MKRYALSGLACLVVFLGGTATSKAQQQITTSNDWAHTHQFHQRLRVESKLSLPDPPNQAQHFNTTCRETRTTRYCFFRVQRFPAGAFKQCVALGLKLIAQGVRGELMQERRFLRRYHGQVDCGGNPDQPDQDNRRPLVEFNFETTGKASLLIWVRGEGVRVTQNTFFWP